MHNVLSSQEDPGSIVSLQKFQTKYQLLSLLRHPNIVRYLSTSFDEESGQPVLLMELCDESLTKFLERSPGPLPYHTELSISHDIALALIYLHSNGLLHRDLSGNNVLMDGGRAKVTDFGMSKFQSARLQTDTVCPGSVHYMSPEALDEPPSYTEKLDIFSFGVLLVQIMTRKFPDPGPRFRVVHDPRYSTPVQVPIREVERRQAHLQLIDDTHPLKLLALQCLNDNKKHRPTAQELGKRIEHLKATQSCPTSCSKSPRLKIMTWTQSEEDKEHVAHEQTFPQMWLEQLEQMKRQLVGRRVISNAAHKNLEKANLELEEERKKLKEVLEKEKMREKHIFEQDQRREREVMEREQKWKKDTVEKEKQMEKLKQQLEDSQEFVKAFQQSLDEQEQRLKQEVSNLRQSLQQKQQTISSLQATVVSKERRIEELEQQVTNGVLPVQKRIVPSCVKPTATLPHCTSQGIKYNDEWNDFTLKIPEGAIPEGESLTIDIGVALYGPFQYPEGLRPVSPVFWICVRDRKAFHFLKPMEVTLPHFLTLDGEEDVQSLRLTFLKGEHRMEGRQKTHFQQAEGMALFRPGSGYGVLHTHHFCYLCIASRKSKETIQKAKFCMFATIPCVVATHNDTMSLPH